MQEQTTFELARPQVQAIILEARKQIKEHGVEDTWKKLYTSHIVTMTETPSLEEMVDLTSQVAACLLVEAALQAEAASVKEEAKP